MNLQVSIFSILSNNSPVSCFILLKMWGSHLTSFLNVGLKIEESLMEKHINPGNDKVDDLSADSKIDDQGQNLLELDANGNFDPVHDDHLSELGGSCESERNPEKFFNEAEKLHALVPYDINGIAQVDVDATGTGGSGAERVADIHLEIIPWGYTTTSSTSATSPKSAQESKGM